MLFNVMQRNKYEWTRPIERERTIVLDYTFDVPDTETVCWVRVESNGQPLLIPLLFSSSYAAPSATSSMAQLTRRCNPSQTDGSLRYVNLHVRPLSSGMRATISVTQLHPDGRNDANIVHDSQQVPVNCSGLYLPNDKFGNGRNEIDTFEGDLRRMAGEAEGHTADLSLQCMRMNHSAIDDDVANTKLSIITAGHKLWEDTASVEYGRDIQLKQVSIAPKFVVCTSNRIWHLNGGDPDFVVCCLKQSCVDQINMLLPFLSISAVREKAMRLIRNSIAGPVLGSLSDLIFCCDDAPCVMSPTVLVRKPTRGKVMQGGALRVESSIVMLDTQTETEVLDNPSVFGDMLLLRFVSNDTVSLHRMRSTAQAIGVPRPLRRLCQLDIDAYACIHVPIVINNPTMGRSSTRLKTHALCDFMCAIDLTNSRLLAQQTRGNTYETHTTLRPEDENRIRTKLFDLRERYSTFDAFSRLVGHTALPKCLALVETDTGNVVSSASAVRDQFDSIDTAMLPRSHVGKQIYDALRHATFAFVEACTPFQRKQLDQATEEHLAPLRHADQLGRVHRICLLASGSCNSPTNNRALVLVHTHSPPDVSLLFIDRHLGTDPEYFSSDLRMDTTALHKASSVRAVLGLESNLPFSVQAIRRLSSANTNVFTNKYGALVHGKQHVLFAVQWTVDNKQWNESTFSAFSANRVRTDHETDTSVGRIITITPADRAVHCAYNPNWSIRLVHTTKLDRVHLG
jgi:hypothetical protein